MGSPPEKLMNAAENAQGKWHQNLLFQSLFHGAAKNFCSMALQDVVKPIDVMEPLPGPTVNDLAEIEESRLSQFQQLLALQIRLKL
jgi:hypothetical protein